MTDREALTAALDDVPLWIDVDDPSYTTPLTRWVNPIITAARERLAQLPEKCEHGYSESHDLSVVYLDPSDRETPRFIKPPKCSGRVYPAELVERIAETIVASWEKVFANYQGLKAEAPGMAVAVLDALNGETP